ncbi:alkaline phosphatase D family protein [Altererythrobacter arenosus]|uniref:Alkaline phosphatase D family protein n=1 Tax=Altererythrobacter arenosus TaxID=3032592 RepID=A0ABY8FU43_9SPHN|nr:alkaline phosphatase D family protein [Altererythrobacter sp. CAU 1644]WFL78519.1 alkaline phosphatase D family protein [Altererythrobacter sp. CAU 1644]
MIASEPPARPTAALTRRGLFQLGAAGAALAATPLAAQSFGTGFTHGVASGEPSQASVLLWTRFVGSGESVLTWEVSDSMEFLSVVASGNAAASAESDWCAKGIASGLAPNRWYYYRFVAPDGSMSDVGRTRTLPAGGTDPFRMAIFSCSNFGFGYFNAYAHAAETNDADFAVHLGDYIYEYNRGRYPSAGDTAPGRVLYPENEIVALADYRLRYATYRADPDLRRIHQLLPMITIWDDHESANDSWKDGAENHQSDSEGEWEVRKAVALRAYREWMPVSDEVYASYEIGDLATLFRLDTRLEGREQPFNLARVLAGADSPEKAVAALTAFRTGEWASPGRTLLGMAQEGWLAQGLKNSRGSGKVWQVLAQQVVMGQLMTPPSLVEAVGDNVPDFARRRVMAAAMAGRAGLPSNMDAWDGYPAARERLLGAAREADANLVVLAGDSHNAWSFELSHAGEKAGVEFAVQSVSSPGLEAYLGSADPAGLARSLVSHNEGLKFADTSQRGYSLLELTQEKAVNEYRFTGGTRTRSSQVIATRRLESIAGSHSIAI